MRIIVWGINYAPELTGIAPFNAGLCEDLRRRGHTVEMITGFPYYPRWEKAPGDRGRLHRREEINGVPVYRCWQYVPRRVTTLRRIAHELTFGLGSLLRVLLRPAADVYIVVSPPLILGPLASLLCRLKRRPYVFHVQDLQPDAAVGLGMVKPGLFTRLLYRVEAWAYRDAAAVSGISDGMMQAFAAKGVPESKRWLFPNWIRGGVSAAASERCAAAAAFRAKYGIPAGCFLASYSGNLGRKQGLETLVEAVARLDARPAGAPGIQVLLVGDGAMRETLAAQVRAKGMTGLRMLPLLDETDYQGMLAASDVSLIVQSPGTGQYFFPSKLLSILTAGCPVLSVADDDSELAKAVADGAFGRNVRPADPTALAQALEELAADPAALAQLRRRTAWVERFSAARVLTEFEARLSRLLRG